MRREKTTRPSRKLPEIPADDSSRPALMTPRRLAAELERLAVEISRAGLRLRRDGQYVDHRRIEGLALDLQAIAGEVEDLSGAALIGKLAIVAGADDAAGRDRYPLLERPSGPEPKPAIAIERDFEHLVEVDPVASTFVPLAVPGSPAPVPGKRNRFKGVAIAVAEPAIPEVDPRDLYGSVLDGSGMWNRCHKCKGDYSWPAPEHWKACHLTPLERDAMRPCSAKGWRDTDLWELGIDSRIRKVIENTCGNVGELDDEIRIRSLYESIHFTVPEVEEILRAIFYFKLHAVDVDDLSPGDARPSAPTPRKRKAVGAKAAPILSIDKFK